MVPLPPHQYIDRDSGAVCAETLFGDRLVHWLYGPAREKAPALFNAMTSARWTNLLGYLHFDSAWQRSPAAARKLIAALNVDLRECLDPCSLLVSARAVFERRIAYWQYRPMPKDDACVVSPADAKVIVGGLDDTGPLFIKEKFFCYKELLGGSNSKWLAAFDRGDVAVFRLTPEKYHYNHLPVTGTVVDMYDIKGCYHSCNPAAVSVAATPYSKNKRVVTVIDTDVPGGTRVGLVAMIEVVALMIGDVQSCYSGNRYDRPRPLVPAMRVLKGQPKSLFRPGSSVDVLLFERGRVTFDPDLTANSRRTDVVSRFSKRFTRPLVETDVRVRSSIASRAVRDA